MLRTRCPITGSILPVQFGSENKTNSINVLHPLLLCDYAELQQLDYPHSPKDQWVLFCAYLYQVNFVAKTELIRWNAKLDQTGFSTGWLTQIYPELKALLNTLHLRNNSAAIDFLVGLRITTSTGPQQIQVWIESCRQILADNSSILDADARNLASQLLAANIKRKQTGNGSGIGELAPKELEATVRYRIAKTQRAYLEHCLDTKLPADKIESIAKVVFRPNDYEVITLRQVKAICLELLWEHSLEYNNLKTAILRKLDQVLFDKLSMLEILGAQSPNEAATHSELKKSYTIDLNGTDYHNGIIQNKYGTSTKEAGRLVAALPQPEKIYTSQPVRSDFPNDLAYTSAMRIYSRQQARK